VLKGLLSEFIWGGFMSLIVQKFGGTSVSTEQARQMAIEKILYRVKEGYSPIVVVSAMGRSGDPYATDTLISLAKKIYDTPTLRELDLLMSCGELITAVIFATTLNSMGHKSIALTGGQAGIITDENFGDARITQVNTDYLKSLVVDGYIPIVTGFQGISQSGQTTPLGRGGSDITATILGARIKADIIEIYTDVDGVMTADPRIVPEARVIDRMEYTEVFQLAEHGAKVIHPRAVEYAMKSNVPIVVKNTYNNGSGTLISIDNDIRYSKDGYLKSLITGIAYTKDKCQVIVNYDKAANVDKQDEYLLDKLVASKISIDMINFFESQRIFIIGKEHSNIIKSILNSVNCDYTLIEQCCKITIIGNRIAGVPGIMLKIIKILYERNIDILQTSDSHTTISCLIKERDMEEAVNHLHSRLCI